MRSHVGNCASSDFSSTSSVSRTNISQLRLNQLEYGHPKRRRPLLVDRDSARRNLRLPFAPVETVSVTRHPSASATSFVLAIVPVEPSGFLWVPTRHLWNIPFPLTACSCPAWRLKPSNTTSVTLPPTFIQRERDSGVEFCLFGRVGQRGPARRRLPVPACRGVARAPDQSPSAALKPRDTSISAASSCPPAARIASTACCRISSFSRPSGVAMSASVGSGIAATRARARS